MHTAHLDPTTAADLRALAVLTGRPEPALLREAIAAYRQDLEDIRAAQDSLAEMAAGAKPLSLAELDEYLGHDLDR